MCMADVFRGRRPTVEPVDNTIKELSWIHSRHGPARYKPLVDALAADIRAGRLAPGTRLPTHRQLAAREGSRS